MQITQRAHIVQGALNLGLCAHGGQAVLVDSGLEAQTAKKALRLAEELGVAVKAVINTHSHADHCGGNAFLQQKLGVKIYASDFEAALIENTDIEGLYLYGAEAPECLCTKFCRAEPTKAVERVQPGGIKLCGMDFGIVALPGHMPGQIGVEFDGAMFCGDALMSEQTWDKYRLIFLTDVHKAMDSCDFIAGCGLRVVGVHTGLADDGAELARFNKERLIMLADELTQMLAEPAGREELLARFAVKYGLSVAGSQFFLLLSTVSAYLKYLQQQGAVACAEDAGNIVYYAK